MRPTGILGITCAVVISCALVGGIVALAGCVYYLNPQCNDRIKNGEETGVDCGGTCGRCNIGDGCRVNEDCDDSNCVNRTCTAFACSNAMKTEAETDVDCGGPDCRKCAGGRGCAADSDCFSGTCVMAGPAGTCSQLATISFGEPAAYPSGDKAYAIFAGDLDGDGKPDIAAANELESTVSVFLNDGTGVFTRLGGQFPTGEYPTGIAIADLDNDSVQDVVTADYHGDSVSVLINESGGQLDSQVSYPTVADGETSNLTLGDLNGDGNLDVVAANPFKASFSVFLGTGEGTLGAAINTQVGITGGSQPYSTAVGDFNGDGVADVAVGDVVNAPVTVLLGNNNGTFGTQVPYAPGGAGPYILVTADLNLDGAVDIVAAARNSRQVIALLGRGDGTFRRAIQSISSPATPFDSGPYSMAVADFNQDGVPDVATANYGLSTVSILLGNGDGSFAPPIDSGAMGDNSYGVAVADFNGDGKPDIATANANSDDVTVRFNTSQ